MNARRILRLPLAATLAALAISHAAAQRAAQAPPSDAMLRAMRDELARSIQQLRLDTLAKPYFIAYRVTESRGEGASARLGSLLGENAGRENRLMQVEVRVGDYKFDNTNYFGAGFMPSQFVGFDFLPIDDDYTEFRRHLWLATDKAYKQALEALSQKRAAMEARSNNDSLADFSHEAVTNTIDDVAQATANKQQMQALAKDLSAVFRDSPEMYTSSVGVSTNWSRVLYVNSEGTSYSRARPRASVNASASTQALDGTALSMNYSATAPSFAELPNRDSLMKGVKDLVSRLSEQRRLPVADAYDGPVLFEGEAAAELFNMLVANKLVGSRRPVSAQAFGAMMAQAGGNNEWEDLIGATVLPRWMTVVDDPSLATLGGKPVESYTVDEEGVATRATTIVDHGVLKTLLTGRTPVTGVEHSSGNHFGNGARPVHVIVKSDSTISHDDLRKKLLALAAAQGRTYGVVVTLITSGNAASADPQEMIMMMVSQQGGRAPQIIRGMRALKVYADGHEEPMRAADMTGLSATSFKEIVGTAARETSYSLGFAGGASPIFGAIGGGAVNYQVPDLLFPSVSVRKPRANPPRLPFVDPPKP